MAEGIYDVGPSAADIMTAPESHGEAHDTYRPMRGQAYVELLDPVSSPIMLTGLNPREDKWHRGRVIALGEPAFLGARPDSPEVPWDCQVGDEVIFVLAIWMDRMRILRMPGIKRKVAVVGQVEIMGVVG